MELLTLHAINRDVPKLQLLCIPIFQYEYMTKAIDIQERDKIYLETAFHPVILVRELHKPSEAMHGVWQLTSIRYPEHLSQGDPTVSKWTADDSAANKLVAMLWNDQVTNQAYI